jgi:hypothetical protein
VVDANSLDAAGEVYLDSRHVAYTLLVLENA